MKISKDEFDIWMRDLVTVKFFKFLQTLKQTVDEELLDSSFLLEPGNAKKIAYKVGYKDMIDDILLTVFEVDVIKEEE